MASMVATTCFNIFPPQTVHPHLTFTSSLFPNPTTPLKTLAVSTTFAKLPESRVTVHVAAGRGIRSLSRDQYWRTRVGNGQSDYETSNDCIGALRSFIFGDGDPNRAAEEERWKLISQCITSKGGVIAAEELAPYLDPSKISTTNGVDPADDDEMFMLPVLRRFDGHPVIDDKYGNVLYRFISLQPTAKELSDPDFCRKNYSLTDFFVEKKWKFSKTSSLQKSVMVAMGALCLFGALKKGPIVQGGGGCVNFLSAAISPLLSICAVTLIAIPAIRLSWFFIIYLKRNADIEKRNLARERASQDLRWPDVPLRRKLETARDLAKNLTVLMFTDKPIG